MVGVAKSPGGKLFLSKGQQLHARTLYYDLIVYSRGGRVLCMQLWVSQLIPSGNKGRLILFPDTTFKLLTQWHTQHWQ